MTALVPLVALWSAGLLLLRCWGPDVDRKPARWPPAAAESIGLGVAVSYLVFLWGVWVRPAGASWLAVVPTLAACACLLRRRRAEGTEGAAPAAPWTLGEKGTALAVAFVLATLLALLFATPLLDWDARILWALKAKILAAERTLVSDTFRDPYRLHIHPRYPLLVPWLASLPAQVAGRFREAHFQAVAALAALLGVLQLYRMARSWGSRQAALLAALLLVLTAGWQRSLFAAGVELWLSLFLLLGVQALWRWLERGHAADLCLAGVYLFGCASVKNEGLVLAASLVAGLGLVLLARGWGGRRDLAALLGLPAVWCALMSVWWWHVRFIPPVSDENYLARLRPENLPEALGRLPLLARELAAHALDVGTWHLIWVTLPIVCFLVWRRGARSDPQGLLLVATCALYGAAIAAVYLFTPWRDPALQIQVTFDRVFLPLLPLAVLLILRAAPCRPRA
ncbi:MAG TPA: glycosyltransferase family 39 protein [bacterium]